MISVSPMYEQFNSYNILDWQFDPITENYSICLQESILTKQITNIKLNFAKFTSFLDSNKEKITSKIKNIENQLIAGGVNIKELEKIGAKHASISTKQIKSKNFNVSRTIDSIIYEFQRGNIFSQITMAIAILCVIVLLNSFFHTLFLLYFSKKVAWALTAVIIAPLVEETGKFISIQQNSTMTYFIVFNIFEFGLYLYNMLNDGFGLPMIIIGRSMTVMMHGFTTLIQKDANNKGQQEGQLALIKGIFFHGLWNLLAVSKTL